MSLGGRKERGDRWVASFDLVGGLRAFQSSVPPRIPLGSVTAYSSGPCRMGCWVLTGKSFSVNPMWS